MKNRTNTSLASQVAAIPASFKPNWGAFSFVEGIVLGFL